jgi:hypothetical protein
MKPTVHYQWQRKSKKHKHWENDSNAWPNRRLAEVYGKILEGCTQCDHRLLKITTLPDGKVIKQRVLFA